MICQIMCLVGAAVSMELALIFGLLFVFMPQQRHFQVVRGKGGGGVLWTEMRINTNPTLTINKYYYVNL
jgi:hypothetical protein